MVRLGLRLARLLRARVGGPRARLRRLWDRGRDLRERIRQKKTGETRTFAGTALLDWGFAEGAETALLELLAHLTARTRALGRDFLMLSVDQQPELAKRLEPLEPATETRYLRWSPASPAITRPYTRPALLVIRLFTSTRAESARPAEGPLRDIGPRSDVGGARSQATKQCSSEPQASEAQSELGSALPGDVPAAGRAPSARHLMWRTVTSSKPCISMRCAW